MSQTDQQQARNGNSSDNGLVSDIAQSVEDLQLQTLDNTMSTTEEQIDYPLANKPKEFKKFRKLPIELRLKIWRYADPPKSRAIEIFWSPAIGKFYTETKTPVLLHVCRESRAEVIDFYSLLSIAVDDQDDSDSDSRSKSKKAPTYKNFSTYIDNESDFLCFTLRHHRINAARFLESQMMLRRLITAITDNSLTSSQFQNLAFDTTYVSNFIWNIEEMGNFPMIFLYGSTRCCGESAGTHRKAVGIVERNDVEDLGGTDRLRMSWDRLRGNVRSVRRMINHHYAALTGLQDVGFDTVLVLREGD